MQEKSSDENLEDIFESEIWVTLSPNLIFKIMFLNQGCVCLCVYMKQVFWFYFLPAAWKTD